MTDLSRDRAPRRPWWAHALVLALVVAAGFGAVMAVAATYFLGSEACPGYDGEGIMAAPVSPQGRVLCGEDLLAGPFVALLLGIAVVLLVVALWQWVRRRVVWFLVAAVLAPLLPLGVGLGAILLPAECTEQQWAQHGAAGCERDREKR